MTLPFTLISSFKGNEYKFFWDSNFVVICMFCSSGRCHVWECWQAPSSSLSTRRSYELWFQRRAPECTASSLCRKHCWRWVKGQFFFFSKLMTKQLSKHYTHLTSNQASQYLRVWRDIRTFLTAGKDKIMSSLWCLIDFAKIFFTACTKNHSKLQRVKPPKKNIFTH